MKSNSYTIFASLALLVLGAVGCRYDKPNFGESKDSDTKPSLYMSGHWEFIPDLYTLAFYNTTGTKIGAWKMALNKNYCRPTDEGKALEYAPGILYPKPSAPTEPEYNAAGWYRNEVEAPNPPEGKIVGSTTYFYDEELNAIVADYEYVDPPPPTLEEYDAAMEDHLRQEREARGYTTREPDSYLTSSVPRWSQDAKDWVAHRDAVMEYALGLINDVQKGLRKPPTMEEFINGLPTMVWTYGE